MNREALSFWGWFFLGSGGKRGFRRLVNAWLLLHLGLGIAVAAVVQVPLSSAGNTVLLPLAGIFIGLAFAWAGNAQSILQTDHVEELAEHHPGGFVEYVFVYQNAILVIILTLVAWGLAGLEVFDQSWPTPDRAEAYFAVKVVLFSMSSLTLRECWGVVIGTHWLLLAERQMRAIKKGGGAG